MLFLTQTRYIRNSYVAGSLPSLTEDSPHFFAEPVPSCLVSIYGTADSTRWDSPVPSHLLRDTPTQGYLRTPPFQCGTNWHGKYYYNSPVPSHPTLNLPTSPSCTNQNIKLLPRPTRSHPIPFHPAQILSSLCPIPSRPKTSTLPVSRPVLRSRRKPCFCYAQKKKKNLGGKQHGRYFITMSYLLYSTGSCQNPGAVRSRQEPPGKQPPPPARASPPTPAYL